MLPNDGIPVKVDVDGFETCFLKSNSKTLSNAL